MKTIYNQEYSNQYNILFDEAWRVLKEEGKEVPDSRFTSLEEYFTCIGDLADLYVKSISEDAEDIRTFGEYSKFLMLPLNETYGEDLFVIDSNTRNIKVPSNFSKNGVSLTGDILAETLIFEIDRFFDTTDLVTTQIYIQWTNPANEQGATKITLVDYNLIPGKIIFGWPLSDKITKEGNGKLTFSVRFLKRSANGISYSLNTLPVTVSIKQALRSDWAEDSNIDNPIEGLLGAITNGPDSTSPQPKAPIFFNQDPSEVIINLQNADGSDLKQATLEGQAYVTDSGIISYELAYTSKHIENNEVVQKAETISPLELTYVETSDVSPVANKTYWEKTDESDLVSGQPIYVMANTNNGFISGKTYYEAIAKVTIQENPEDHVTGEYEFKATNTVGRNVASSRSNTFIIPTIEDVQVKFTNNDLVQDTNIFIDGENSTLTLETTLVPEEGATSSYKWYKKVKDIDTEEWTWEEEENTNSNYEIETTGWYYATVVGELNGESMTRDTAVIRALKEVVPVVEPAEGSDTPEVYNIAPGTYVDLTVTATPSEKEELISDNVTYEWYRMALDSNTAVLVQANDPDIKSGANGPVLTVTILATDKEGVENFQCVVTNHLAGKKFSAKSNTFTLTRKSS